MDDGGKVNEKTGEMSYGFASNLRDALPNASFLSENDHRARHSLDLWHVAAALETGCSTFASYDARQREVAALCGLEVIPVAPAKKPG